MDGRQRDGEGGGGRESESERERERDKEEGGRVDRGNAQVPMPTNCLLLFLFCLQGRWKCRPRIDTLNGGSLFLLSIFHQPLR